MVSSTQIEALTSALVARFLRSNNYTETLQAFIREAGLPADVGQPSGDDTNNWTIQTLLEEKKAFDHSVNFERYGEKNKEHDLWTAPCKYLLQSEAAVWRIGAVFASSKHIKASGYF